MLKTADTAAPSSPSGPTPTLNITWAGETEANANSFPPDNTMAAGAANIITAVNFHIDIYDKTGNNLFTDTLQHFFNAGSDFVFDPRVLWDQYANRFIVVADDKTGSNSVVHMAVSKDANPLDGWFKYDFNVKDTINTGWLDYPIVGIDNSTVYFGGNYFHFSPETYIKSSVWAIDKSLLESGQQATAYNYDVTTIGAPANALYTPAHMYGTEAGLNGDFLVQYSQNNSGNDTLNVIRLENAKTGSAFHNIQSLNVNDISDANNGGARQPGTGILIDTGDHRVQSAVWRDDKLYATTEIRIGSGSNAHDVVHWFVVDTSNLNNLTLLSQGNIDYGSSYDTYYGNMTVDRDGNMIIGYALSGTNIYGSSVYAKISPGGTSLQDSGQYLTQGQGSDTQTDTSGRTRWGDYSGVSIDPTDDKSFWVFNQYATTGNSWATTIGGSFVPLLIIGRINGAVLIGGPGNDTMDGRVGTETLTGGAGSAHNAFLFDTRPARHHVDLITNFRPGVDTLEFDHHIFKTLAHHHRLPALLHRGQFDHERVADTGSERILYDQKHGALYYDQDGNRPLPPVKIAVFLDHANVSFHDILIV